jgi:hypothetical protein
MSKEEVKVLKQKLGDAAKGIDALASAIQTITGLVEKYLPGEDEPPPPPPPPPDDIPLDKVRFLHADRKVLNWPQTSTLESVKVDLRRNKISLKHTHARKWPAGRAVGEMLYGNPWVILNHNNRWYAATWEWLRPGQFVKAARSVAGDHIKKREIPKGWRPSKGQLLGFFVSTLARGRERTVNERTNIVTVTWP